MNTSINYATFIVNSDKPGKLAKTQTKDVTKYTIEENHKQRKQEESHVEKR